MEPCRSPALVLKTWDYGESDKIVILLSPLTGRLTCIAKGAKRSLKRFVNKLEPFTLLSITYTPGRQSLALLTEAQLEDGFFSLRSRVSRYTAATLICESVLCWCRENDAEPDLFDLLVWSLARLEGDMPEQETVLFFLLKLYGLMGYQPVLDACVQCRKPVAPDPHFFLPARHGVLCLDCGAQLPARLLLSPESIVGLRKIQEMPLHDLPRLTFSRHSLQESLRLVQTYGDYLLQREIHSWKLFKDLVA